MATLPSFFNDPTTSICFSLIINCHSLFLNVVGMNYGSINTIAKSVFSNNLYINMEQWHANIRLFNLNYKSAISKNCPYMNTINYKTIILLFMLLLIHGDTESNPGPPKKSPAIFHFATGMLMVS